MATPHDFDLHLGSGHVAYRRSSLIDPTYVLNFIWDRMRNSDPQISPCCEGPGTHLMQCYLVHTSIPAKLPNGISFRSVALAGCTSVTDDIQTDRLTICTDTSVTVGGIAAFGDVVINQEKLSYTSNYVTAVIRAPYSGIYRMFQKRGNLVLILR